MHSYFWPSPYPLTSEYILFVFYFYFFPAHLSPLPNKAYSAAILQLSVAPRHDIWLGTFEVLICSKEASPFG